MQIIYFSFLINYKLSDCKDYVLFIFKTFPAISIILNVYDMCSINICWPLMLCMGFPDGSNGKKSTSNAVDPSLILSQEDPLEKGIATHSSIPAWRIPWTEEPGGLQSMGSQRWRTTEWQTHTLSHKHTMPYTRYKDIVKWNGFQFLEYIEESARQNKTLILS